MRGDVVIPAAKNTRILVGDNRKTMPSIPSDSVHLCCTSPPYWGLRDYGTGEWSGGDSACEHKGQDVRVVSGGAGKQYTNAGSNEVRSGDCACGAVRIDHQIGLERTPEEFIENLVAVFREVRRILHPSGVLAVNLGDTYYGSWGNYCGENRGNGTQRERTGGEFAEFESYDGRENDRPVTSFKHATLKPKDLCMMPARLAMALQGDGWWLRSQIPWIKRNGMPSSCLDRPGVGTEYFFLLAKSERYFWDPESVRIEAKPEHMVRYDHPQNTNEKELAGGGRAIVKSNTGGLKRPVERRNRRDNDWWFESWQGLYEEDDVSLGLVQNLFGYRESHFATYPPGVVVPFVRAGTSEHGCCAKCSAPYVREMTSTEFTPVSSKGKKIETGKSGVTQERCSDAPRFVRIPTGKWIATCECGADVVPCTVFDPFLGSGTTLQVARYFGRKGIGCELNAKCEQMARRRIAQPLHFTGVVEKKSKGEYVTKSLFD